MQGHAKKTRYFLPFLPFLPESLAFSACLAATSMSGTATSIASASTCCGNAHQRVVGGQQVAHVSDELLALLHLLEHARGHGRVRGLACRAVEVHGGELHDGVDDAWRVRQRVDRQHEGLADRKHVARVLGGARQAHVPIIAAKTMYR